jgi:hypothetical protein
MCLSLCIRYIHHNVLQYRKCIREATCLYEIYSFSEHCPVDEFQNSVCYRVYISREFMSFVHYHRYVWSASFSLCQTRDEYFNQLMFPVLPTEASNAETNGYSENTCPCNRPWRPIGFETSRFPHFLDDLFTDIGEVVSLNRRPPFTPKKFPGTHFC